MFRLLVEQLNKLHDPKIYTSSENLIWCSISLVFRPSKNKENDVELLYIRRAINPTDRNSGEIAFPGGVCETGEDDYTAAIRETYEEVGLDLQDEYYKTKYLGRIPRQFIMSKRKGKRRLVTAHCFLIQDPQEKTNKISYQESEVCEYRWVSLDYLAKYPIDAIIEQPINKTHIDWVLTEMKIQIPVDSKLKGYRRYINIQMGANLYGLTMIVTQFALCMIVNHPAFQGEDFKSLVEMQTYEIVADSAEHQHISQLVGQIFIMQNHYNKLVNAKL